MVLKIVHRDGVQPWQVFGLYAPILARMQCRFRASYPYLGDDEVRDPIILMLGLGVFDNMVSLTCLLLGAGVLWYANLLKKALNELPSVVS